VRSFGRERLQLSTRPTAVVGVPLYGRALWLHDALDSLLAQTYRDAAFVLVDDCSPDESFSIASEYARADPRVLAVRNSERLGLVGAWRRAFAVARESHPDARYFAWGSDHDFWEPGWLEALVAVLEAHPEAVLAYPYSVRLSGEGEIVGMSRWFETAGMRSARRRLTLSASRMAPGNMLYGLLRVSALERAGPFPNVVGPDRLLLAHLAVLGEFRQVPQVLWHRRFEERVTARRQRAAFFPDRRPPSYAYVPWWIVHGAILLWRYGVHGEARPGLSRPAAVVAAISYVVRSARARLRRNLGRAYRRAWLTLWRILRPGGQGYP
jgi:glycosyltransferase involved in cell wall biosynthesis